MLQSMFANPAKNAYSLNGMFNMERG